MQPYVQPYNGKYRYGGKNKRVRRITKKNGKREAGSGVIGLNPNAATFIPGRQMHDTSAYESAQNVVNIPSGSYQNIKGTPNTVSKRKTQKMIASNGGSVEQSVTSLRSLRASTAPVPETTNANWAGNLCYKLAFGYWCSLRRAYFTVGWPGQNDKYVPPYIAANNWDPNYPLDRMFINYLAMIFCNVHDSLRDGTKPQFALPKHLMFALQMVARKTLVQTNVATVDLGTYAMMVPWAMKQQVPQRITLDLLQEQISGGSSYSNIVDMYNWIANHPKRPFEYTDAFVPESPITIYTKENSGELIHSTLKYDEITSIFGFSVLLNDPTGGNQCFRNYDFSGLKQPSSTMHFRTMFYLMQDPNLPLPVIDGVAPPVALQFQYVNPDLNLINYCMSGFVVTAERIFTANVPWPGAPDDQPNKYAKSFFLDTAAGYAQKSFQNVSLAVDPLAFNCGLALAMALQTKNSNFVNQAITSYYDTTETIVSRDNSLIMAVAVAQFPERIPLPSPLFEEFKAVSDVKTWTYEGVAEPVGSYYKTTDCWDVASVIGTPDPKDPKAQINFFFSMVQNVTTQILPFRSIWRLNHAPEIGSYMPNMHLFYTDGVKIFTPLDSKTFDDRDIAIFINYSLMPVIPSTVALPLNFLSVKNRSIAVAIAHLAALSIDVSTNSNSGSEVDEYYRLLRMKHIGFWGALAGILGATLPKVIDFASHIFKPTEKTKEKINNTVDNVANGSQLVNSLINGVINHIDNKQIGITGGRKSKFRKILGLASNGLGMVANLRDTKIL